MCESSTNVSELRGFLGLVQYVGRYVPDLATVAAPLRTGVNKEVGRVSLRPRSGEEL